MKALVALIAVAGCGGEPSAVTSAVTVRAGDVACGGSIAIQPVAIDNCAYCSFDDYPSGRAPLPPDAPPVAGPVDIRALIGPDCAARSPELAPLVAALRAAIDDALAIARERVQACYSCDGGWEIARDACGLPVELASQVATGCAVEVTLHPTATCACPDDPHAPAEICGDGRDNDGDGLYECEDPGCLHLDGTCDAHETACGDGEDNDRDGAVDCHDPDCASADGCRFEPTERCGDGFDDDGDGLVDCADPDCAASCVPVEQCANGVDDDGDGLADCADPSCAGEGACPSPVERCGDGDDDDGDGLADCADPDCAGSALCAVPNGESCAPGVDRDGDGLAGCADPDCRTHPACWSPCGDCWN